MRVAPGSPPSGSPGGGDPLSPTVAGTATRSVIHMEDGAFLEQALDIGRSWYVESVELDRNTRFLTVHLDFERGGTFTCGGCGRKRCKAYDTYRRQWRHMNLFRVRDPLLEAPSPRVRCPTCGIRQASLEWVRRRSRFTLAMEAFVAEIADDASGEVRSRAFSARTTRA